MRKLLLFFVLFPLFSNAQKNYPALLDSFMQAEASIHHFNGNVLVARADKPIYQKAFGYRNFDTKEVLSNNSVFEVQSITKQFTAIAILQLVEKGKLTLQDTLRRFFPELPYANVTIHHLLTHTSGLPDDMDVMAQYWDHKKVSSNKDLIQVLSRYKVPAHFQPGEKWEYNNTAFILLGSIIEKVSGLCYAAYMQKHIFAPMGMKSSYATTGIKAKDSIADYAYGFIYSDSLKKYILPATLPELDFVHYQAGTYGAGNISSTTSDLFAWDRGIKQHKLLGKQLQEAMLSPQSLMDTSAQRHYGYGVFLGTNEIGNYIMRGGSYPGYHTMLMRYVDDDLIIIVLSNNEANTASISGALAYILTDRSVALPYIQKQVFIDTSLLNNYVGRYKIPNVPQPLILELLAKGGKLYYHFGNIGMLRELKAESKTKFFTDAADQQVEFEVDSAGKVVKAFFIYGGMIKQMEQLSQ